MTTIQLTVDEQQRALWEVWRHLLAGGAFEGDGELLATALTPALQREAEWRFRQVHGCKVPLLRVEEELDLILDALRQRGIELRWHEPTERVQIRVQDGQGWCELSPQQGQREVLMAQVEHAEWRVRLWRLAAGILSAAALGLIVAARAA